MTLQVISKTDKSISINLCIEAELKCSIYFLPNKTYGQHMINTRNEAEVIKNHTIQLSLTYTI